MSDNVQQLSPMSLKVNEENTNQSSITQKVFAIANDSLRRAANAIFRATARINNDINVHELLSALEDVAFDAVQDQATIGNPSNPTQVMPILSSKDDETESMATSCSTTIGTPISVDSTFTTSSNRTSFSTNSEADAILEAEVEPDDNVEQGAAKALPIITMEEVGDHYSPCDAWMVIYDRVYNFTEFLEEHPGGFDIMMEYIGYDGTIAFRGSGHSPAALKMMEPYLIGILPESQRMYTNRWQW